MMLHRHFDSDKERDNLTTLADVTPGGGMRKEFVSEIFPPDEPHNETRDEPKRRGRPRKA